MARRLFEDVKVTTAVDVTAGAAGSTDINGATLDMLGYSGLLVIVNFGAITSGAATSIKLQQDNASTMAAAADLEGTGQTVVAVTDNLKSFYIDLYRPLERYVRLVVKRATQNSVCSATYIQYGANSRPSTHGSGVGGESWSSPAEGTA